MVDKRPALSKTTKVSEFKNFYWDKQELIAFCRKNKIPADGGKIELAERIEFFLSSGGKVKQIQNKSHKNFRDSDQDIALHTPVINYKNDAKTRDFFYFLFGRKI